MNKNDKKPNPNNLNSLYNAFSLLESEEEVRNFLHDLCTSTEIHAMSDRWFIAKELAKETPRYIISGQNALSISTVSRVASFFKEGAGGYKMILGRLKLLQ